MRISARRLDVGTPTPPIRKGDVLANHLKTSITELRALGVFVRKYSTEQFSNSLYGDPGKILLEGPIKIDILSWVHIRCSAVLNLEGLENLSLS